MPLSAGEQAEVERCVKAASNDEMVELRGAAEQTLQQLSEVARQKIFDAAESKAADSAIEFLVRIEVREKGGGWWFRLKRRAQLVQTYFGSGSAVTSFAIKSEANDHAVRLKTLTEMAARYLDLPADTLREVLARDFSASQISGDSFGFVYRTSPEFEFRISGIGKEKSARSIMVMGRGELTGYTLYGNDGGTLWFSVASDGPFSVATGAAMKLAKTMQAKFDIDDLSRLAPAY